MYYFKIFILFLSIYLNLFSQNSFIVGVENIDYYPHFAYRDGKYEGFARELLDLFAKKHGYKFEYKPLSINRLYKCLITNQIDFKYPDNKTWGLNLKKGSKIYYSDKVVEYIDGISVSKKNLQKTKLKTLGTVYGFTPWDNHDKITFKLIQFKQNHVIKNLINQTLLGKIDGVYANVVVIRHKVKHKFKKEGEILFNKNLPYIKSAYSLSTSKHGKIILQFNEFLKKEKKAIEKLKLKYKVKP